MKRIFRDDAVQAEFAARGFVKLPWLDAEQVATLTELYDRTCATTGPGFSTSFFQPDSASKQAVRDGILAVFERRIADTFVDPSVLMCSFITKTRGDGRTEYITAHQDWTFVDETEGDASVNVWCALEDTDAESGNLCVVPGSNLLPHCLRPAEPADTPYKAYYEVLKSAGEAVPARAGEAVLFNNSVVHFSTSNRTERRRLVAGAMVVGRASRLVLYYQNAEQADAWDEYEPDVDHFISRPFGSRPGKFLRTVPKTRLPNVDADVRRLFPQVHAPAPAVAPPTEAAVPRRAPGGVLGRIRQRLFG